MIVACSYGYIAKQPDAIDVACPAWTVRRLRPLRPGEEIDLSLERGLAALQGSDGGFELTPELLALIGLEELEGALALAEEEQARAMAAVLVLKCVSHYKGNQLSPGLSEICFIATSFACQALGVKPAALSAALESVGDTAESFRWPTFEALAAVLRSNFAPKGRWSFFELWAKLLPESTVRELREDGGVLGPRFFLVDLASAPLSPYDLDKAYPLVRHGKCVFVGQPCQDDGGGRDAMRQGRQLEAALLSYGWLEEDHVLTELRLPHARAFFSAAPDAIDPDGECPEPLAQGDTDAYQSAGYGLAAQFPFHSAKHKVCRLWRADFPAHPPESYVEVKKTTHLNGRPGEFKKLKFWLQAVMMRCGAVIVALTEGSPDGDTAREVRRITVPELASRVETKRVWGGLDGMLQHILKETAAADGPWTLQVKKDRGPHAPVRLELHRGWAAAGCEEDCCDVLPRFKHLFHQGEDEGVVNGGAEGKLEVEGNIEHAAGDTVEVYWPDDDTYLPAQVVSVKGDLVSISWDEDGSISEVPSDYVRIAG